jgi:tetratricopeptide (TPR) repeat protein
MTPFDSLRRRLETEYAARPFEDAIAEIGRHLRASPGDFHALRLRADYSGFLQDWAAVAADLEAVRRLDPAAAFGVKLAYAYRAAGRLAEAEAEYTRELGLSPGDCILLEGRAAARERRGDLPGALRDWRAAVEINANDHALLAGLAAAEGRAGLLEDALTHLDAAVFLVPDFWPHLLDRGLLQARLERWAEAEEDLGRAIARLPGDENVAAARLAAHSCRGWARLKLGRAAQALEDLDEAVRLGPRDAQALRFRALAHAALGDKKAALADFKAAAAAAG